MPSRNVKKKYQLPWLGSQGIHFFMEARLHEYKKKDSSQPSMIAMLVNLGSMSLKKRTRGRTPMNGNASTVEPPGKKASNEIKAGEASFKIYRLLQV